MKGHPPIHHDLFWVCGNWPTLGTTSFLNTWTSLSYVAFLDDTPSAESFIDYLNYLVPVIINDNVDNYHTLYLRIFPINLKPSEKNISIRRFVMNV